MKRIILGLYIITAVAELVSLQLEIDLLHHFTKPLLMVWLLVYFAIESSNRAHKLFWIIVFALIFSWLGDVMLMYQVKDAMYFMLGLGAFLIAHVFYIVGYRKARNSNISVEINKPRLARYDFFLLLIYLTLLIVLKPHLGELLIPVVVYAFAITYMAISALHRYGRTSGQSFWMVMIGALIFMFSDSTIAINKFIEPINHASLIIMTTYLIAQFLIIEGISKHIKLESNLV